MATICIFEDSSYTKLLPLVYTRAVYEIRCGINLLFEKIVRMYPNEKIVFYCRDYIADVLKESYKYPVNDVINDDCLFINGKIISDKIPVGGNEEIGVKDGTVVYIRVKKDKALRITPQLMLSDELFDRLKAFGLKTVDYQPKIVINYFWDAVHNNPKEILNDFKFLVPQPTIEGNVYDGVHIINKSQVYIGKGSQIKPGVVIDAENGPVYIGEDVLVQPNAVIEGPSYIGNKSIIRIGAKIREGTSLGEVSRVGGEVECSIIHSYSNKQHDGFLGHSYIGMWCNLGAGTNNSDLKNNYGNVKVYVEGKLIDSGNMFVGLLMSDHSKSGIGTSFNTGSVIGVSVNVYGGGTPPKYIPSFSWGAVEDGFTTYRLDEAINTARIVLGRRKLTLTQAQENLLRKIFEMTAKERERN